MSAPDLRLASVLLFGHAGVLLLGLVVIVVRAWRRDRQRDLRGDRRGDETESIFISAGVDSPPPQGEGDRGTRWRGNAAAAPLS